MAANALLRDYLLRLGDNALILSQQLGALCGKAPALEEDMALTNTALDLLGQARLWYAYAAELTGDGATEDRLAYLRDAHDFHNLLLVEQSDGNFADTMARQFYFDAWHFELLKALRRSTDRRIAEIAEKSAKEVAYHLERSTDWVIRLGDGTDLSHQRMQAAIDDLWMYTGEMFEADALEQALVTEGIAIDPASLHAAWHERVQRTLTAATLALPGGEWMQSGGKQGRHTEKLGYILAEMQFLQRAYPNSQW